MDLHAYECTYFVFSAVKRPDEKPFEGNIGLFIDGVMYTIDHAATIPIPVFMMASAHCRLHVSSRDTASLVQVHYTLITVQDETRDFMIPRLKKWTFPLSNGEGHNVHFLHQQLLQ